MSLADRVARLERLRRADRPKRFVHVETLPGMTREEGLRLWYGPDRGEWPSQSSTFVIHVNAPWMQFFFDERMRDAPYRFMESRSDLLFQPRWKALCSAFDTFRVEVRERDSLSLMEYHQFDEFDGREMASCP